MIDEEELKNAFIAKLACIGEQYNEDEVKWNTGSKMTRTIDFPDGSISNAIVKYYRKDGSVYSSSEYTNAKRHGMYVKYFDSGKVERRTLYKDGKKQFSKEYFYNGLLKKESHYVNGRLDGFVREYGLHAKETIKHYKKKTYLYKITPYKYGKRHGLSSVFYPNGNKKSDIGHCSTSYWVEKTQISYDKAGNPIKRFVNYNDPDTWQNGLHYYNRTLSFKVVKNCTYATHYIEYDSNKQRYEIKKLKKVS